MSRCLSNINVGSMTNNDIVMDQPTASSCTMCHGRGGSLVDMLCSHLCVSVYRQVITVSEVLWSIARHLFNRPFLCFFSILNHHNSIRQIHIRSPAIRCLENYLIYLEKAESSTMGKRHQAHVEEFIDDLHSDKLSGFRDHEYTIVEDWNLGFRLGK